MKINYILSNLNKNIEIIENNSIHISWFNNIDKMFLMYFNGIENQLVISYDKIWVPLLNKNNGDELLTTKLLKNMIENLNPINIGEIFKVDTN